MAVEICAANSSESVFDIGQRLEALLNDARQESAGGAISETVLARPADMVEVLRSRLVQRTERDPRSLFDPAEPLIAALDRVEPMAEEVKLSQATLQENKH